MSAYLYPFIAIPKKQQYFKVGSRFADALALYNFDQELRALVFDQIGKIEVAVRSTMANIVAKESGNIFWPTDNRMFANAEKFQKTISVIETEISHTREDFITHFKNKYSNPYPPAWMLFEILPVGTINYIYNNISNNALRKKIAEHFSLTAPVFSSWLTIIALTRNATCHHARIWNKENAIHPSQPRRMSHPWIDLSITTTRFFYNLCIIKYFVDIVCPENNFKNLLANLLAKYCIIDLRG